MSAVLDHLGLDRTSAWQLVDARDTRYDGRLFLGVTSTGIYCRPSCPARTPHPHNCEYFASAAAARAGGFRACKRCRPDQVSAPADALTTRALELIEQGAGDAGVAHLARTLAVSPRHLGRLVRAASGLSVGRLAALRRAQLAHMLLRHTTVPITEVGFAAGYASVRQFNDAIRAEFAATPRALRAQGGLRDDEVSFTIRLAWTRPYACQPLWRHLVDHAVPGLEQIAGQTLTRLIPTAAGPALVHLTCAGEGPTVRVERVRLTQLPQVVGACSRWLDVRAPVAAIDAHLAREPWLAPLVRQEPGLRVAGTVSADELVNRAVLGQHVSTAAARTLTGRLVARWGELGPGGLREFPRREVLAALTVDELRGCGLPAGKASAVLAVARAEIDYSADPAQVRRALLALRGIGPWTADYVAMRALGQVDVLPLGDLVIRAGLQRLGVEIGSYPQLSPWRSYAASHVWYNSAITQKGSK